MQNQNASKTSTTFWFRTALNAGFITAVFLPIIGLTNSAHAFGDSGEHEVNTNPVTAIAHMPSEIPAGGAREVVIDLQVAEHFHAYVDRFKLEATTPDDLKIGDLKISPITKFMDSVSKKMRDGVQDSGQLRALVEVPQAAKLGPQNVKLKLTYQACSKETCLFPKSIEIAGTFNVISGGPSFDSDASIKNQGPAQTAPPMSEFDRALGHGVFVALLAVFGMGFLTSLTPCIYPMIPITLAVLGARTQGQSRLRSFSISFTYVLGLAFTYSLLGVAAAKTGSLFGSALSNVYIVTGIALLFVTMGLSMYGMFELQVPAFLRNRLGTAQTGAGYGGAFATGMIAGVVASPCVGPVLVSVLTYIAQTQNLVLGFLFLFSFAMGMGVLFMVLGTSSALIGRIPKAGAWMDITKFVFGTAMVAMALYYIAPLYPKWLFNSLLGTAVILIASAYGAFESNEFLSVAGRVRKGAMLAAFVVGLVFAMVGLLDKAGIAIPGGGRLAEAGQTQEKLAWKPYSDSALQAALASKRPVVIDFYADWCGACKELEHETFTDSRVRDLSRDFVLLQINATDDFPGLEKLKQTYSVRGLPTMVFFDRQGRIRPELTLTGFEDANAFLKRMSGSVGAQTTVSN